jgi:DNA-binding MarR family transcriptional regulator
VRGFGLTRAQWMLLAYAARHPGATQSDLAEILQQEKITISRQAARLEKDGWLDRATDGRIRGLLLTPKAREMVARLTEVGEQLRSDALGGLPAARREALVDDLLLVKAHLQRMIPGGDGELT